MSNILLDGRFSGHVPAAMLDHARAIGLSLLRTFADRPSYVLGVTSALPAEGKTTICVGLAEVMSTDFGLEVLLIDLHAERPWPQVGDQNKSSVGVSDWLVDERFLESPSSCRSCRMSHPRSRPESTSAGSSRGHSTRIPVAV